MFMIRADDLGMSKAVNYGIYECVKNGTIKNIGLMVNMEEAIHGYELVKEYDICLGQHTNVCLGKPISDTTLIPSLVDEHGYFKSSKVYRSSKEDIVDYNEALIEVEAQYQRFKEITGYKPHYFEAHAVDSDNLDKAIEEIARRHHLIYVGTGFDGPIKVLNYTMTIHMESMNKDYNPFDTFKNMIDNDDENLHMMVCHPGYLDEYLLTHSSLTYNRTKEVSMLTSDEYKEYIKDKKLYTYDEL